MNYTYHIIMKVKKLFYPEENFNKFKLRIDLIN